MSKKNEKHDKLSKSRNMVAKHAHINRGGAHEKSKSGQRQQQKSQLNKELSRLVQQGDFDS